MFKVLLLYIGTYIWILLDLELVMKLRHTTYQSRFFYCLGNLIGYDTIKVSHYIVSFCHLLYTQVGNLPKIRANVIVLLQTISLL